jgi:hypothetical protein
MNHTRCSRAFIKLLPFRSGLSSRLRRHLEQCPECQERMASIQEARAATVSRNELGQVKDFWPRFALSLKSPRAGESFGIGWRWSWALGLAGFLALAIVGLFFFAPSSSREVLSSGVKLRVNYVRMYEEPAQAFIFQTQDANSTFVWVEKPKPGEVL